MGEASRPISADIDRLIAHARAGNEVPAELVMNSDDLRYLMIEMETLLHRGIAKGVQNASYRGIPIKIDDGNEGLRLYTS